jgi:hypothetical protein
MDDKQTELLFGVLNKILLELKIMNDREEAKAVVMKNSKGAFSAPSNLKPLPSKEPIPMPPLQPGDSNTFTLPDVDPAKLQIMEFDQKFNKI